MNKEKNKINKKKSISDDFPLIFPNKKRSKRSRGFEKYLRLNWDLYKEKKVTGNDKRAYFEELYNMFNTISWKTLPSWGKTIFWGRWFYAISDSYVQEYIKNEYVESKIREISDSDTYKDILNLLGFKNKKPNFLKKSICSNLPWNAYISVNKKDRDCELKDIRVFTSEVSVSRPSIEYAKEIEYQLSRIKGYSRPDIEPLKLLYINVRYPIKQILSEVKNIIEHEQKEYYSKFPEEEALYIKKTKDGRTDSYSFDEWERYLKIYMLKKLGKTNGELAEQFYHTKNEKTIRQVLRDNQKAKTLSKNAVEENFPGKYY